MMTVMEDVSECVLVIWVSGLERWSYGSARKKTFLTRVSRNELRELTLLTALSCHSA